MVFDASPAEEFSRQGRQGRQENKRRTLHLISSLALLAALPVGSQLIRTPEAVFSQNHSPLAG
jgi:hypothetical protein